jgi:glycosyltransferase involved in cell wall biosynthesis
MMMTAQAIMPVTTAEGENVPLPRESNQSNFGVGVCITTMNRPEALAQCLAGLSRCTPAPALVVVSDDSSEPAMIAHNRQLVAQHPGAIYLGGPRRGVCANRNNALAECLRANVAYVAFVDDDLLLGTQFFGVAERYFASLPAARRALSICTGQDVGDGNASDVARPTRLSFRGYFMASERAECVNIHAAVFPASLFRVQRWDENIFFGSEDAELCLRAVHDGYVIDHLPGLTVQDTRPGDGVLHDTTATPTQGLTRYQMHCEAARLYIGVKRYKNIAPDKAKLLAFVAVYFGHLLVFLTRRRALHLLPRIVGLSNVGKLLSGAPSQTSAP